MGDLVERLTDDHAQLSRMVEQAKFCGDLVIRVGAPGILLGDLAEAAKEIASLRDALATARREGEESMRERAAHTLLTHQHTFVSFTREANGVPLVVHGETEFMTRKEVSRCLDVLAAVIRALPSNDGGEHGLR